MKYRIVIKDSDTHETVKVIECSSERNAERALIGVITNINADKYYAYIESDE